jgi:glycerol-3-phosphate dehydrogenase
VTYQPLSTRLHLPPRRKLTDLINESHVNEKYMPGCFLGTNVVACSDLLEAAK